MLRRSSHFMRLFYSGQPQKAPHALDGEFRFQEQSRLISQYKKSAEMWYRSGRFQAADHGKVLLPTIEVGQKNQPRFVVIVRFLENMARERNSRFQQFEELIVIPAIQRAERR